MAVKKKAGVPDLAVIFSTSEHPTTAAGCFQRNPFKAAPIVVSEEILRGNSGRREYWISKCGDRKTRW